MRTRDRIRILVFFTPALTIPLAALAVVLVLATPLIVLVPYGWVAVPVAVAGAVAVVFAMRSRYRMSIIDSSPLGVVTWLQRRRG
jgi:hypothetical protein